MIGIVDVGGGMRGVYGAGVFDWCMDHDIQIPYLIGVSAGSANIVTYASGQRGRNIRFYTEYSFRSQYMGKRQFLRTGNYLNLEYIYGDGLTNSCGEDPLDFPALMKSGKQVTIVTTDAMTGRPVYYKKEDMQQDDYGAIKGSSCVPIASRPYEWKGSLLYDGGLSDPIPIRKAFDDGCDRLILILTRPRDYRRSAENDVRSAKLLRRKYPAAAKALEERAYVYNHQLDAAVRLSKEGKILILAPYSIDGMKTLTRDRTKIRWMYDLGMEDAARIRSFIQ